MTIHSMSGRLENSAEINLATKLVKKTRLCTSMV